MRTLGFRVFKWFSPSLCFYRNVYSCFLSGLLLLPENTHLMVPGTAQGRNSVTHLSSSGWALFRGIHVHLLREVVRKWLTESMGGKKTSPSPCACVREGKQSPGLGLGLQSWCLSSGATAPHLGDMVVALSHTVLPRIKWESEPNAGDFCPHLSLFCFINLSPRDDIIRK